MNTVTVVFLVAALGIPPASEPGEVIQVDSAVITLIEEVEVPATATGALSSVPVREGRLVQKGDLLARIDDTNVRLLLERARTELAIARQTAGNDVSVRYSRKKWDVAFNEVNRARQSRRKLKNSVSDTEYDRLKLLEQQAKLEIEQAEHDLQIQKLNVELKQREAELAEHELERRRIVAPIAGMVVQVNRRDGEWVEPGDTILRIVRVDRLRAEGFLDASRGGIELIGRPATLTMTAPDGTREPFSGEVVFVSPEVNPVNGQVRVRAEFDNRGLKLRPGQKGRLRIGKVRSEESESRSPETGRTDG